jgi:hypothetical protein
MQDNQPNVEKEKWLSVWGFLIQRREERFMAHL